MYILITIYIYIYIPIEHFLVFSQKVHKRDFYSHVFSNPVSQSYVYINNYIYIYIPIEHFLVDDQFEFRHFIIYIYIYIIMLFSLNLLCMYST